jgi:hypothetical protein
MAIGGETTYDSLLEAVQEAHGIGLPTTTAVVFKVLVLRSSVRGLPFDWKIWFYLLEVCPPFFHSNWGALSIRCQAIISDRQFDTLESIFAVPEDKGADCFWCYR